MSHLTPEILGFSIYTWIMFINLIILIVTAVLGGDFDFDADVDVDVDIGDVGTGVSPLSLPVMAMFGTAFGGTATILDSFHWPTIGVIAGGVLAGAAAAGGIYYMTYRMFLKTQVSSDVILPELIGREGNITIPVTPDRMGEVLVITAERGRTLVPAVSGQEIPTHSTVVIEGVAGNALRVRKVD